MTCLPFHRTVHRAPIVALQEAGLHLVAVVNQHSGWGCMIGLS